MRIVKKLGLAFVAAMVAMILFAVPVAAQAAFLDVTMDRQTVVVGDSVTFQIRTTSQANHVFAMVDGARINATRNLPHAAGPREWTLTITPAASTDVSIFANSTNTQTNAARIVMPITVTGTAVTAVAPNVPVVTSAIGPVAIAHVLETPSVAAGQVQLTVVTGLAANEVWVNFDRANNVRGTGRFTRGTVVSENEFSRTWVINFTPRAWAVQTVEVGANRTYNWPGAGIATHTLTLAHGFVPPVTAANSIQAVTLTPAQVSPGAVQTFNIRTDPGITHVWLRDMDGREVTATRQGTATANHQNWRITFTPPRSGQVTVFANTSRTTVGAASTTRNVVVGGGFVDIHSAHANVTAVGGVVVTVTTNANANAVWVTFANEFWNTVPLTLVGGWGTNQLTWQLDHTHHWWLTNQFAALPIRVFATSHHGHGGVHERETTINHIGGAHGTGFGTLFISAAPVPHVTEVQRGGTIRFAVRSHHDFTNVLITGEGVSHSTLMHLRHDVGAVRVFYVDVTFDANAPPGPQSFVVSAVGPTINPTTPTPIGSTSQITILE